MKVSVSYAPATTSRGAQALFRSADAPEYLRFLLSAFNVAHRNQHFELPARAALEAVRTLKTYPKVQVTAAKAVQDALRAAFTEIECPEPKAPRLYPYQRRGVEFLRARQRALLADEMGTGKSVMTLTALSRDLPALVVCPPVMVGTWYDEARKWRPDLTAQVWKRPWSLVSHPGELTIVPYSQLPHDLIALEGDSKIPVWKGEPLRRFQLVCDEAHYLKNSKTRRTRVIRAVQAYAHCVWLLTGTPLLNRPPELWAILQAMKSAARDVFGSYDKFQEMFRAEHERIYTAKGPLDVVKGWGEPTSEARARLQAVMLRRTRAEVLPDLPKKSYQDIRVELGRLMKDYRELALSKTMLQGMSDDAVLEACGEAGILSQSRRLLALAKMDAVEAFIEECEESGVVPIVFSYHREPAERIGGRKGWALITGSTSDVERAEIVRDFQAGKYRGIAGTIGAMGVGVTLTRAWRVLFIDQSYVPAENLQSEDRAARIGQKNAVLVTRFVSDHPIDVRVSEVLDKKMAAMEHLGLSS